MTLEDKLRRTENLKKVLENTKLEFEEAERNKDFDAMKVADEKIKMTKESIKKVAEEFDNERANMSEDDKIAENIEALRLSCEDLKTKKKNANSILNNDKASAEDKELAKKQLASLKSQEGKLKARIYNEALEKSGLDYANGERYPEQAKKRYEGLKRDAEKRKVEIEENKKNEVEKIKIKKDEIQNQFEVAKEKYEQMLAAGKIDQNTFDNRIKNMEDAKRKDAELLDNKVNDIDKSLDGVNKEMSNLDDKINKISEKAKIYDRYNQLYQSTFGESLDKYTQVRSKAIRQQSSSTQAPTNPTSGQQGSSTQVPANPANGDNKIEIKNKEEFKKIYKKLKKGDISKEEREALYDAMKDKANYEKLGITTGIVFNKGKTILNEQGKGLSDEIEFFIQNMGGFDLRIKHTDKIEGNEVLSPSDLKNFEKAQELSNKKSILSVEEYIKDIEEFKNSGNDLTDEQKRIYDEAINLKQKIGDYRGSIENYASVKEERSKQGLFNKIKGAFLEDEPKTLPTPQEPQNVEQSGHNFFVEMRDKVENGEITQEQADSITRSYDKSRGREIEDTKTK